MQGERLTCLVEEAVDVVREEDREKEEEDRFGDLEVEQDGGVDA